MKKATLAAGTAVCAILAASSTYAQSSETTAPLALPQAVQVTPQVKEHEPAQQDIVVTGFRRAYENALSLKRKTDQITDSISSDGLGRFPDLNVGEAIQRLPGVQINREADGRNATISLRGLPGSFARTTLNGGGFADPILGAPGQTTSTPFGAFNSDIFTAITIIKTPSAADLSGGLSGIIDLRIAPALGRKDGGWAKASYEYNDLGSLGSPAFGVGYNKHLSDDFAVFGVITYKKEKFRRDSISSNNWNNTLAARQVGNQAAAGSNPVFDALAAQYPGGVYYPSQFRQFSRMNSGSLLTGAGGFEWKATDTLTFGVSGFYTERKLDQSTNQLLIVDTSAGANSKLGLTPNDAVPHFTKLGTPYVVQRADGPRAYINQFSGENIDVGDSMRSVPGSQKSWSINPTLEFRNDDWRVTAQGTVSRARVFANEVDLSLGLPSYRNLGSGGLNGNTADLFSGGSNLSDAAFILDTPIASHMMNGGYPLAAGTGSPNTLNAEMPGAAGVAGNRFSIYGTNGMAKNELDAFQLDLERNFEGSFLSGIQVGLRYERNAFISSGSRNSAMGVDGRGITPDVSLQTPYAKDFFDGNAPGFTSNWRTVDLERGLKAILPVNTALLSAANPYGLPSQYQLGAAQGVFLTPYGLVNAYTDPNYWNNNFVNSRKVMSAYVMAKFDHDIAGIHVRGNAGLRYEGTTQRVDALACQNCSIVLSNDPGPLNHKMFNQTFKSNYDFWLPSAMFAADLTSRLVLRGAYYKTFVRPQPRDILSATSVAVPDPSLGGTPIYTVAIGSPDIKPYTANSYDVSLEWYNRPGGTFAVAIFQKDVKGYIGDITDKSVLCPADGRFDGIDFGLGPLAYVGPNCTTGTGAQVQATGQTNQRPMRVRGVEVSMQQNLDFLPGLLKYFGVAANYTYIDIKGVDAKGRPITLPSVAKSNINLTAYYETKLFGVRAVFNHRGKYDLAAGNTFVGDARSVKARSQLDASASLNVTDNITLSVDAFNLTNAMREEYETNPMLPRRIDYDGRTYTGTIRATF